MTEHTTRNLIEPAASITEIYLRSAARLVDIQAAATQSLFRQSSEMLLAGADQAATFVRQTSDTVVHLQNALQQYLARQAGQLTLQWQENTREVAREVERSTDIARAAAERTTEGVQNAVSGFEGGSAKQPAKSQR